jgi:hypothetical protein
MYLSNHSKSYYYGAIIDLQDSVCYRAPTDTAREEMAKKCVDYLNKNGDASFFCAVRQRRYVSLNNGYIYLCEGGAEGALRSLWRYIKGRKNEVFPIYGCVPKDVERLYFSSYDDEMSEQLSDEKRYYCIEPGGIFSLGEQLNPDCAAYPRSVGYEARAKSGILSSFFGKRRSEKRSVEALYSEKVLEKFAFFGTSADAVRRTEVEGVAIKSYPSFLNNVGKENIRTLML